MRATDLRTAKPAPYQFWPEYPSPFFVRQPDWSIPSYYENEGDLSEWLYFLEQEQTDVFCGIADDVSATLREWSSARSNHFVMGGPGTGKTCILLQLLKYRADEGYSAGIVIADHVAEYIEKSTNADLSKYRVDPFFLPQRDVLLIDDPVGLSGLFERSIQMSRSTVVAFDPLQLSESLTDSELSWLETFYDVKRHVLQVCYRQKEIVGKTTKHVVDIVAASTPFFRQDKIDNFRAERHTLTNIANEMRFVNPFGHIEHYENATVYDIQCEVNRILNYQWLMWKHWPGLLLLLDGCELSDAAYRALQPLMQRGYVQKLSFRDVEQIKGLEFQHVFIFMTQSKFQEIQTGFTGSGQKTYHQRRLLRIPFSRAKDSLVTFGLADQ
jgi:hypothetical protein